MFCLPVDEIEIDGVVFTKYYSIYLPDESMVVLSDLHIGFEEVMAQKGLILPKLQKNRILNILEKNFDKFSPSKILIDGDFKHEFSKNVRQEWREITEIIEFIKSRSELIVVRGNHDNYLKNILARYSITLHNYYRTKDFTFIHGDKKMDWKGTVIIGHEHPSIKIRDSVGGLLNLPVFLHGKNIIVLPSPSVYSSGSDILGNEIISPVLSDFNMDDLDCIGIDEKIGILEMGKIKDIKEL